MGRGLGPIEFDGFRLQMGESRQQFIEYAKAISDSLETGVLRSEGELYRQPAVEIHQRAGIGYACTEAPRGILYHRYKLSDEGLILDAKIVPPTSQNQKMIEDDLRHYVEQAIELPEDQLMWQCEQAIRNYDPCISCATHFLKLQIERE